MKIVAKIFYFIFAILIIVILKSGRKLATRHIYRADWEDIVIFTLFVLGGLIITYYLLFKSHDFVIKSKKRTYNPEYYNIERLTSYSLYLRSFDTDEISTATGYVTYNGLLFPNFDHELENIQLALKPIGETIAIGKPTGDPISGLVTLPAFQENVWKQEIIKLISNAKLIIIRSGVSEALKWEIDYVLKNVDHNKIVFLLPNNQSLYNKSQNFFEKNYNIKIPDFNLYKEENCSINSILYYRDLELIYTPLQDAYIRTNPAKLLFPSLRIALKPVFENNNIHWTPPPIPLRIYFGIILLI
ncbi:hypothetical protein AB9P05_22285 [Roseivirga sp. BDSF3-8]|uniref:hypothetical protein n=1 Tax=Roseivirga sp. BDSF3-8 TaxID=3241598 RepID=UPI003532769F